MWMQHATVKELPLNANNAAQPFNYKRMEVEYFLSILFL